MNIRLGQHIVGGRLLLARCKESFRPIRPDKDFKSVASFVETLLFLLICACQADYDLDMESVFGSAMVRYKDSIEGEGRDAANTKQYVSDL